MSNPTATVLQLAFPHLTPDDVDLLEAHIERKTYPADTCLCKEGEIGEIFYVLESGTVNIFIEISPEENLNIKQLAPGGSFGEMALVADQPRSATARTATECTVLEIDKHTLETVLTNNPRLLLSLMRRVSRNLWDNDRRTIQVMQRKNDVLAQAYARLEAQTKLRTEFITTLSHELRTPLTAAQGFLHFINSGSMPEQQTAQALATVTRNIEQVVAITNSLIILHEMDLITPQITPVNLVPLVNNVIHKVTSHRELLPSAVVNTLPDNFGTVPADASGLSLVLHALVDNAVKFSQDSPVTVSAERQDETIIINVIDQGLGMSEETLEHVFEPYFKLGGAHTDRLFDGLGIGLAIAKFIVERHNGRITVASQEGEGSTFSVYLPAPPAPHDNATAAGFFRKTGDLTARSFERAIATRRLDGGQCG